jgi:hypothetical protein
MTEEKSMDEHKVAYPNDYDDVMNRVTALCKGFLLVADKSMDKACSFCRGLLILLAQLNTISAHRQNT